MKKIGLLAAIAAIICGLLVYKYTSGIEQRVQQAEQQAVTATVAELPTVEVVAAAREIPAYSTISEDMLKVIDYPEEFVPEDAVMIPADIIGLRTESRIISGELIYKSKLGTDEEVGTSLSYEVPDGMRAMTLNIGTTEGVAGFLTKGDHVDIVAYVSKYKTEDEMKPDGTLVEKQINISFTEFLIENAEILALGYFGQDFSEDSFYYYVTLALNPEECLKLNMAETYDGVSLSLVLRQRGDGEPSGAQEFMIQEITG